MNRILTCAFLLLPLVPRLRTPNPVDKNQRLIPRLLRSPEAGKSGQAYANSLAIGKRPNFGLRHVSRQDGAGAGELAVTMT